MTVAGFYDIWDARLREDHRLRNPRVVSALNFAERTLEPGRLLDIGCGIGWTSAELAAMGHTVIGVDISPCLINTARTMFGDCCEFRCLDFTAGLNDPGGFDNIVMIDVYEHFPTRARERVHDHLAGLLRPGARLLVTAPTAELQQAARVDGIAMQPVDEEVTAADLARLADDIGAHVIDRQRVGGLSSCGDYWHFLCEREC